MTASARALRLLAAGVALLVAGCAGLWWLLLPPRLAVPPRGELLFAGVTIVEPGGGRCPSCSLRVRGDRIASVAPSGGDASDALPYSGAHLLPGLVDLHVHHPPAFLAGDRERHALLYLLHGVTSVRDMGSFTGDVLGVRKRIRRGDYPGPRTFACGPFLDGDPPFWPGSRVVRDAAAAAEAVADLAASGVDCVKVYNFLSPEALAGAVEAARRHGLPVVGHVPEWARLSSMRGVEVQHLMGVTDSWEAFDARVTEYAVQTSLALGLTHTPTIVAFDRSARLADAAAQRRDPRSRLLPRFYRELLWNPRANPALLDLVPGSFEELRARVRHMRFVVRALHVAGVRIHVGTDAMNPFVVPGAAVHEELHHLVEAGLSAEEAWIAATRSAGEALARPGLGTLGVGAPADLLVFRDDPTRDLTALATLEAVVADGRLYPRRVLHDAWERQRRHFEGRIYDSLTMFAGRRVLPLVAPR